MKLITAEACSLTLASQERLSSTVKAYCKYWLSQ